MVGRLHEGRSGVGCAAQGGLDMLCVADERAIVGALAMPRGNVADGTPRRDSGPDLRMPAGHEQRHVTAAAHADQVDPLGIDRRVALRKLDGRNDVGHGQIRSKRVLGLVRSAEVRMDEDPALRLAPCQVRQTTPG